MKTVYFSILLLLNAVTTEAQAIQWLDTVSYSGITGCMGLSADSSGYVYIAGYYCPSTTHDTVSTSGIFVSKYDSLGNLMWTDRQNNGGLSSAGLVTDKKGNSYAVFNTHGVATFGSFFFNTAGDWIMMLVKYNSSGAVQWVTRVDNAVPDGISIDSKGEVYVYGGANNNAVFDSYPQSASGNFIARYDSSGTCKFLLSTGQFVGNVSVDGSGNMFIIDDGGLKKYNNTGVLQWITYSYNGVVYADMYGNCYLRGNFGGSVTFGNTTLTNPYSNGAVQSFLAKLDANGNPVWAIAPQNPYYFRGVFLTDKELYVTGNTGNDDPNGWIHNGFVAKYDTSGSLVSESTYMQNNNSARVTKSASGSVYLVGNSWGQGAGIVSFLTKVSNYGSSVGLKENNTSVSKITIYPNPTGGIITIQSSGEIKNAEIKIENLMGQLIYSKKIITNGFGIDETIDLSHSPKGVYFVQVNTDVALEVRKVVLE